MCKLNLVFVPWMSHKIYFSCVADNVSYIFQNMELSMFHSMIWLCLINRDTPANLNQQRCILKSFIKRPIGAIKGSRECFLTHKNVIYVVEIPGNFEARNSEDPRHHYWGLLYSFWSFIQHCEWNSVPERYKIMYLAYKSLEHLPLSWRNRRKMWNRLIFTHFISVRY